MKKVLLTLALAAFAMTANAQIVLGGNVGFDHNGNSTGDYSNTANTTFSFMPKIGYWLNEDMQVGIQLGCDYNYTRNYAGDNNNDHYASNTQWMWKFAPYFRYNLTSWNNFTVFCEAQLGLGITPKSSWKNTVANTSGDGNVSNLNINFNVVPGLNYALTEKISLDAYFDILGLYYSLDKTTTETAAGDVINRDHNWGLIANMNAQPLLGVGVGGLTGHFTLIRIGFNYAL